MNRWLTNALAVNGTGWFILASWWVSDRLRGITGR